MGIPEACYPYQPLRGMCHTMTPEDVSSELLHGVCSSLGENHEALKQVDLIFFSNTLCIQVLYIIINLTNIVFPTNNNNKQKFFRINPITVN